MVEAGQGFGVPRGFGENPAYSIGDPYGERDTLTPKFCIGEDVTSSASALRNYAVMSRAEIEFHRNFLEFNGTGRTYMKDKDSLRHPFSLFDESAWFDKASFMSDGEIKSCCCSAMRANGMSLTMPPAPITGRRSSANSRGDLDLYLDSGAGRNMVFNSTLLINRRAPPTGTDQFLGADGSPMAVIGYGDIEMENFRIPEVYLVEGLTLNLISVGQLTNSHNVCCFFAAGNECSLMLSDGRRIGGAIRCDNNLYMLRFLEIE